MSADNQDIANRLMMQLAQAGSPSFNGIQAPANPAGLMSVLAQMQQQNQLPQATPGQYGYLHDASTRGFQQMGQQLGNLSQSNNTATPINPASIQNPFQGMTGAITQAKQTYASALAGGMPPDAANIKALSGLAQAGVPGAAEKLEEAQTTQAKNTKLASEAFADNSKGSASLNEIDHRATDDAMNAKRNTWQTTSKDPQGYYELQQNGLGEVKRVELKPALASLSGGPMDPQSLQFAADTYRTTGKMPAYIRNPAQLGAVLKQVAADAASNGDSAGAIAARQASLHANQAALSQTTKQEAATSSYFATMDKNIQKASDMAKQLDFGDVTALNAAEQSYLRNTSDPKFAKYNVFFDSIANEYAKVKSGSLGNAVVQDAARQEALKILAPTLGNGGAQAAFDAIRTEGNNRLSSIREEKQRLLSELGVNAPGAKVTAPPAAAPAPAPSGAPSGGWGAATVVK